MKNKFKSFFFFIISISFMFFTACRKDEIKLTKAPDEKTLLANSVVANLMKRTAILDGSVDNIIDKANCILIKLPVSLTVNGRPITVNSPKDYDVIEAIFEDSNSDIDTLTYNFPITIILSDFTEVLINSESELNSYISTCKGENVEDEDIECIDFNYPIIATTFNVITTEIGSRSITNDKELFNFIKALNFNSVVNMVFPITVTLFNQTQIIVNNLDDLQVALEDAINACDEDDDFDFNDDDNTNLSEQEFKDLLSTCKWEIEEFEIDGQNQKSQFNEFYFTFNANGSATAKHNNTIYNGTWTLSSNSGLRLSIQFNDFPILNKNWRVSEIHNEDDGTRLDLRHLEDNLKLKHECN